MRNDRDDAVPRGLQTAASLSWRFLLVVAAVAVLAYLAARLRLVIVPVVIALLLATALYPAVRWLRRRGVPNGLAAFVVLVGAVGLIVSVFWLLAPPVVGEMSDVDQRTRGGIERIESWIVDSRLGVSEGQLNRAVDQALDELQERSGAIASGVLTGAYLVIEIVTVVVLSMFLLFFFLKDGERIWEWLVGLFPEQRRRDVHEIGTRAWHTLGGYLGGTALVAFVDAVFIGLALLLIGVPLVVPLAVLTFVGGFFPIVGAFVAGAIAALVALVSEGVLAAVLVVGAAVAVQQLEGNLLQPFVVGRAVRLHPVAILLALTSGALVWGVLGAFFAVPFTAVVARAASYIRSERPPEITVPDEGPVLPSVRRRAPGA
jgi:predicted PurR-regulated permease PerM